MNSFQPAFLKGDLISPQTESHLDTCQIWSAAIHRRFPFSSLFLPHNPGEPLRSQDFQTIGTTHDSDGGDGIRKRSSERHRIGVWQEPVEKP
jgi:hypothetical protein